MPRDYAKSSKREKKPGQLPGWAWMLGGLAIGLFVAFLVYLNNNIHPGNKTNLVQAFKDTLHDTRDVRKDKATPPPPPPKEPANTAVKPKPSFDFYTILPELEVAVPEQEIAAQSQKPAAQQQDDKTDYVLQAGSFRDYKQADQLKAKLALQGIDANIQSVQVNQDTWHRVRIGPIHKMATLTATLKRLKEQNIAVIIVKSKT